MSYNNDLISRSALLEAMPKNDEILSFEVRRVICNAPAVDAEVVRHGRWVHLGGDEWCCAVCGEVIHTEGSWEKPTCNYCPDCGAKMDGDEDGIERKI